MSVKTDRAWAAGFFDGEGTTNYTLGFAGPQMAMKQRDALLLHRFCEIVGVGKVYGPYERKSPRDRHQAPFYVWQGYGEKRICHVLAVLGPYLGPFKFTQAMDALIQWFDWKEARGWRTRTTPRREWIDTPVSMG